MNSHYEQLKSEPCIDLRDRLMEADLTHLGYSDLLVVRQGISDESLLRLLAASLRRRAAIGRALEGEWTMSSQRDREIDVNAAWNAYAKERDAILKADPWYPTWHSARFPR